MSVQNIGDFSGAVHRVRQMQMTGASKDKMAQYINAEFHMCAYVSNGQLYAQYKDEKGQDNRRVLQ